MTEQAPSHTHLFVLSVLQLYNKPRLTFAALQALKQIAVGANDRDRPCVHPGPLLGVTVEDDFCGAVVTFHRQPINLAHVERQSPCDTPYKASA